ncbi:MAG: hypothetical protein JXA25_14855 [Anaerolineales bacterium]|nr:hypothetical protein [Anaerolineales bacterium]
MVDKTDKFKPRVQKRLVTSSPAPSPPPLWFGLVVGGFIGVILTTSLAVGLYWMGFLEVNVVALLPTVDPLVSETVTPEAAAAGTATVTPFSVILTTEATEEPETATPSPTMNFNATATAACGVFMDEFPGTPCPSPIAP